MKKGIMAACFAMASAGAAAAGIDSAAIYGALNVPTETTVSGDTTTYRRAAGGLECTRTVEKPPQQHALITVSCTLDFARADAAAIYNALDVPEEGDPSAPRYMERNTRTAGALTCTKSQYIVAPNAPPKPTYSCELDMR